MWLASPQTHAQKKLKVQKPDLEQIRKATLDPASPFYYPKLEKRYAVGDTLMTPEQYRYYYFGAMFQEDYNPYRKSDYTDRTDSLLNLNFRAVEKRDSTLEADKKRKLAQYELHYKAQKAMQTTIREQRKIAELAEKTLLDNPFDLQSMYMLSRLYKNMGKTALSTKWDYRLENLLGAIISSGSGKEQADPFLVISPDHEYFLLEVLGYDVDDYEYLEPGYDYLKVTPSDPSRKNSAKTPPGFYFDVQPLIRQYNLKYPENIPLEGEGEILIY